MGKFGVKLARCTVWINFAGIFTKGFPLARNARTVLLNKVNVDLTASGILFPEMNIIHFTTVDST